MTALGALNLGTLAAGAVCMVMLAEGMGSALAIACGVPLADFSLLWFSWLEA